MSKQAYYYDVQHIPRGVNSVHDVRTIISREWRIYESLLKSSLPPGKDASIYEVACGPGILLSWLKHEGYRNIAGSDISPTYVEIARELGVTARQADSIEELQSHANQSLEAVFAIDFLEHLTRAGAYSFCKTACDKLSSGGILVLRIPNGDSPFFGRNYFNDPTHEWTYSTIGARSLLQLSGFSTMQFIDEATAKPPALYIPLIPVAWLARKIATALVKLIAREQVRFWSSNLWIVARK